MEIQVQVGQSSLKNPIHHDSSERILRGSWLSRFGAGDLISTPFSRLGQHAWIGGVMLLLPAIASAKPECGQTLVDSHSLAITKSQGLKWNARITAIFQDLTLSRTDKGNRIIEELKSSPELKRLFESDAGVREKISIEEHTKMVYEVYQNQWPHLNIAKTSIAKDLSGQRLDRLLLLTIALHDIGKPTAIWNGDKKDQHEFTPQLLEAVFQSMGIGGIELALAKALVSHDVMGALVRGKISAEVAFHDLAALSWGTGLDIVTFAKIQAFFYTIDAASYPLLRGPVFGAPDELNDEPLVPVSERFEEFMELITSLQEHRII